MALRRPYDTIETRREPAPARLQLLYPFWPRAATADSSVLDGALFEKLVSSPNRWLRQGCPIAFPALTENCGSADNRWGGEAACPVSGSLSMGVGSFLHLFFPFFGSLSLLSAILYPLQAIPRFESHPLGPLP